MIMKPKIFTFLVLLFSVASGLSQPLPGSPLPDTITYFLQDEIITHRRLLSYNSDSTLKSIIHEKYTNSSYKFYYRDEYKYDIQGRLVKIISPKVGKEIYYNVNGLDSINITIDSTVINQVRSKRMEYTYNDKSDTLSILESNYLNGTLDQNNFRNQNFFYENELLVKKHIDNNFGKFNIHYIYNGENRLEFEDTEVEQTPDLYKWSQRIWFQYYEDGRLREKKWFKWNNNKWNYTFYKELLTYTDSTSTTNKYFDDVNIGQIFTITFNNKGQKLKEKFENLINSMQIITKAWVYNNNGSIHLYEEMTEYPNQSVFLYYEKYGYKTPDISSNNDLYSGEYLSIYPNPAAQTIYLSDPKNKLKSYRIIDISGKIIDYKEINSDHILIERNGTTAGLYYIQIQTEIGIVTKPILWVD